MMQSGTLSSYLWITEPEIQSPKISEKAEAREENPILQSRQKRETEKNELIHNVCTGQRRNENPEQNSRQII